jgi:formate-dependent nitrite reductase cytochrome c552 subunit
MKSSRFLALLLLLPLIALWGCEGDQGPAGPAGANGADAEVSCLDCHNTDAQNAISLQYNRSQHALGEFVAYAGGRSSCARCHSGNGFAEFMDTGDVDGNITNPTPFLCNSCHAVHTTFEVTDYALRGTAPGPWIGDAGYNDTMYDLGDNSNICAACHQTRRAEPNIAAPGDMFEINSTHYGPHHGAMANVLAGVLFAEIPGSTAYPATAGHLAAGATCVTCHMGDYSDGAGGHTWWPNVASCTGCHAGATDFDINGKQTAIQGLLDDLQALLLAQGVIEWVVEDEAYEPIVCPEDVACYTMAQAQAFYNWIGLTEDRSLGVHNPRYVTALLENSIEAITPAP